MVPIEPVSLTIGAVALASLFSLCVQCFDLIEVGKNLGADYELLIVKLSIEKRRLMIWGEAVGILRPDTNRDPLLDEPETRTLVEQILGSVQKLFNEADALKSKYGLETISKRQEPTSGTIEGSGICSASFESSPIVQFQTRLSDHHGKAGLTARTRWAIRDSKKFAGLIQNLKDLHDGLSQITTSSRTTVLRGQLIKQETESIPDLHTLKIIESTCSDTDWASSASASSSYLGDLNHMTSARRVDIYEWMDVDQGQPQNQRGWRERQYQSQARRDIDSVLYRSPGATSNHQRPKFGSQDAPRLQSLNHPHEYNLTEVLVLCSTSTLVAWVPNTDKHFTPIDRVPLTTGANRITSSRMMKAIVVPPQVKSPCITIYCPPRMRYVHMALSILDPQSHPTYRFHIRIDDRLLDQYTVFSEIYERMVGYHRDLEEAFDASDPVLRKVVDAIDMNWLEQRIDALSAPSYTPPLTTLDWHTIFRQSRDDTSCVGIIIMAGEATCWDMLNTVPVVPPDIFREGRVFRLRELEGAGPESSHRWKAEHYCNVSTDKDFEKFVG